MTFTIEYILINVQCADRQGLVGREKLPTLRKGRGLFGALPKVHTRGDES
jgi:hypothetical protein